MRYVIYSLAALAAYALTAGVFSYAPVFGAQANVVLLLAACLAVDQDEPGYLTVALVGGLLLDVSSGLAFGAFTFTFLLLGGLLHVVAAKIVATELTFRYVLAACGLAALLATPLALAMTYALARLTHSAYPLEWQALRHLPVDVLWALLLTYPAYLASRLLRDRIELAYVKSHTS
jgi:cell shape-determining protein MreD